MTAPSITRRQIVGFIASSLSLLLSGCFETRHRSLSFKGVNVTKKENGYNIGVVVKAGKSGGKGPTEDWDTFHDVELIAETKQHEEIHRESIGDIGGSMSVTEDRSFSVEEVPQYLFYDAKESTCDEQTRVDKAVRIKHEGEYLWEITEMTCEEEQEFVS